MTPPRGECECRSGDTIRPLPGLGISVDEAGVPRINIIYGCSRWTVVSFPDVAICVAIYIDPIRGYLDHGKEEFVEFISGCFDGRKIQVSIPGVGREIHRHGYLLASALPSLRMMGNNVEKGDRMTIVLSPEQEQLLREAISYRLGPKYR